MNQITESEMVIMKIIWSVGGESSTNTILAHLPEDMPWKATTVNTFLTRMIIRGFVEISDRVGRSNIYRAKVTEEEYSIQAAREFLQGTGVSSIKSLISNLYHTNDISKSNIADLKDWLKEEKYDSDHR